MTVSSDYPRFTAHTDYPGAGLAPEVSHGTTLSCPLCGGDLLVAAPSSAGEVPCPGCRCLVSFAQDRDVTVVRFPDNFSLESSAGVLFRGLATSGAPWPVMILDVTKVSAFGPLLGRICQASRSVKQAGGQLRLVASPHSVPSRILGLLRLHRTLFIYNDVADALTTL